MTVDDGDIREFRDVTTGETFDVEFTKTEAKPAHAATVRPKTNDHCTLCRGAGVVRMVHHTAETLALCTCSWAARLAVCGLPVVSADMAAHFESQPCPLAWFLPDNERESVARGNFKASLDAKLVEWNNRVKAAKEFWATWNNKPTGWWQE